MIRYSNIIEAALLNIGTPLKVFQPSAFLSSSIPWPTLKKWLKYFEEGPLMYFKILLSNNKIDVLVIPDQANAWILNFLHKRSIVICHDLYAILSAKGEVIEHKTNFMGKVYQWLILKGLRKSELVLCVSTKTASLATTLLPNSLIQIVENPIDPIFESKKANALISQKTQEKHNYCLIVMKQPDWRKPRILSIDTWIKCRLQNQDAYEKLKIIGRPLTKDESRMLESHNLNFHVYVYTDVSNEKLLQMYAEAQLLINITCFEGFGWPVIEANAMGTVALHGERLFHGSLYSKENFYVETIETFDFSKLTRKVDSIKLRHETIEKFSSARYNSLILDSVRKFISV